jgi:hypothetical protein
MDNRRIERRVASYARVLLVEHNAVGHLRDLSREGCRLSILDPPPLGQGDVLDVVIVPHEDLELPHIPARLTVRWLRPDGPALSLGGQFSKIPASHATAWDRLVDYFGEMEAR